MLSNTLIGQVSAAHFNPNKSHKSDGRDDSDLAVRRIAKQYRPLSIERELELVIEAKRGNRRAEDLLTRHCMSVLIREARKIRETDYVDLVQVGYEGIRKAIDKFDPRLGGRFRHIVSICVKNAIVDYLRTHGSVIRIPRYVYDAASKIERFAQMNQTEEGHIPTKPEISANMGVSEAEVRKFLQLMQMQVVFSLDEQSSGNPEDCIFQENQRSDEVMDWVDADSGSFADDHSAVEAEMTLSTLMALLSIREQEVIRLRFGVGGEQAKSYRRVAAQLGLSTERIVQIEKRAIQKMQQAAEHTNL